MDTEKFGKVVNRLYKNTEFHEFNVHQITKIARAVMEAEERGYTEGMRDGVIDYRKATMQGEAASGGN